MNVLSLFDGMSCGQIALNRAGIAYDKYYASEVDKWSIRITQKNYPDTIQIGDVTQVKAENLPRIGLLLGGSPCQGFSKAGKGLNFDDPRSRLFFEYVRLLKETQPRWFLFENVVMKKEWQEVITSFLGIEPIRINSALVSAQNRDRLYWTNIPEVSLPEDRGHYFGDVKERDAVIEHYYSRRGLDWLYRQHKRTGKAFRVWWDHQKAQMLEESMYKKYSAQRFFGILDTQGLRYVTPLECERLQTTPDGYTEGVSNTQRYKMLGSGWTVDVIAHILGFMATAEKATG